MKKQLSELQLKSVQRVQQIIDEECGGKQQVLADKSGLDKSSISHYTRHANAPGNKHAYAIAKPFGLNPLWVMGFDVPKMAPKTEITDDEQARTVLRLMAYTRMLHALPLYFDLPEPQRKVITDMIYMLAGYESPDPPTE